MVVYRVSNCLKSDSLIILDFSLTMIILIQQVLIQSFSRFTPSHYPVLGHNIIELLVLV